VCGPLWPIGVDAGSGEVEPKKSGNPPGSLLHYSGGGGEVADFPYLLESHMTYQPFKRPQELAGNKVK
jgi:hypothetical protein